MALPEGFVPRRCSFQESLRQLKLLHHIKVAAQGEDNRWIDGSDDIHTGGLLYWQGVPNPGLIKKFCIFFITF